MQSFGNADELSDLALGVQLSAVAARRALDHTPVAQFVAVGERHVLAALNAAGRALLSEKNLLGRPLEQVLVALMPRGAVTLLDQVLTTGARCRVRVPPECDGVSAYAAGRVPHSFLVHRWTHEDGRPGGVCVACVEVGSGGEAARDAFTAGLVHDLRGPLTAVRLALSSIIGQGPGPQLGRKCRRALHALQRADELVENLLDVSRVHAGNPIVARLGEVDLVPALSRALREKSEVAAAPIRFRHDREVRGAFDAALLCRALHNLVQNALAYGAVGAAIEVALFVDKTSRLVVLQVSNIGPALAEADRARILGTFARGAGVPAQARGWGLGLMVVQAVAQAHGGRLEIESFGGSNHFRLLLPHRSELKHPGAFSLQATARVGAAPACAASPCGPQHAAQLAPDHAVLHAPPHAPPVSAR